MNRTQVQYFLTVAKYRSFSEASRQLYVAQSAVSKQILALETELGMRLFDRDNKSVRLTAAGEVLYREWGSFSDWLDNTVEHAKQASQGMRGTLNISVLHGIDLFNPDITHLYAFSEAYPDIYLDLRRLSFQDVEEDLITGRSDITIILSFLMPENSLPAYVLESNEDYLAISQSGALGAKERLGPEDFQGETFVTISPSISPQANANSTSFLNTLGIRPTRTKHVNTIEDMMLFVEAGLGYAVISNSTRIFKRDTVRVVDIFPASLPRPTTNILAVWHRDITNPAITKYIEFVRAQKSQ